MNAKEAAEHLRPTFRLESEVLSPEVQHDISFHKEVATELGVEHTPFNLHQVAESLAAAGIERPSNEFPKMLYSRTHPDKFGHQGTYDQRHDHVWVKVHDADQEDALGESWVDHPDKLPPRGNLPLYPVKGAA